MNHGKILSMMLISIMLVLSTASIVPTVAAGSPKAVYGTLYVDSGQGYKIAEDGIEVKIVIDGDTFDITTKLNETSQINYGIGIPPGYEAKTGYFYVHVGGTDWVPDDNESVFIDSDNTYRRDLHVTTSSGGDDDDDDNGGGGTGGGGTGGGGTGESITANFSWIPDGLTVVFTDESTGPVTSWSWDFDGDDVVDNTTQNPTYTYDSSGKYNVTLTVSNAVSSDSHTEEIDVFVGNNPPTKPTLEGSGSGSQNIDYTYIATSTDPDNHSISYTFNWGDGTEETSDFIANGTSYSTTHAWTSAGKYGIWVEAIDDFDNGNGTPSGKAHMTVLIDVWLIDDVIQGYLIDDDSDGTYDLFHNDATGYDTSVEKQEDGTYLIDSDGDGNWDYVYDIETDTLTEYTEPTPDDNTLLLIVFVVIIILILIIVGYLLKRKKDKK